MKVYLVEIDNGELYDDYSADVEAVFTSYRLASKWLISEGYKPYGRINFITREWEVAFSLTTIEGALTSEEVEELRAEDAKHGISDDDYDFGYFGYEVEYCAIITEMKLRDKII